jgi:hypothetical protein
MPFIEQNDILSGRGTGVETEPSPLLRETVTIRPMSTRDGETTEADGKATATRFEELSHSASGLHYVRERKGGVMRVLTDSELADFSDPKPCPSCAEQFGCEHFNCAGEPLLDEAHIAADVPREWLEFAKEFGLSRPDLVRLQSVQREEGEYRVAPGVANPDMRLLELVLLLNDAR